MQLSNPHFLLMTAFHGSNRLMQKLTAPLGLFPGQPKILETLWAEDGLTPKALSVRCVLDQSSVTSLLRKLENKGCVRREALPGDRRSVRIFLTDEGRRLAAAVTACGAQVDAVLTGGLGDGEKKELLRLLQKIAVNTENAHA